MDDGLPAGVIPSSPFSSSSVLLLALEWIHFKLIGSGR